MAKEAPATPPEKMSLNRREALNFAWLASLGIFTASTGWMTFLFAMPRFKEGEFGGVVPVNAAELPPVGSAPANFPKVKLWLSNTEEGVYALYKVCTHLGCLYGWSDQENKFICPCHGSQFQLNGEYILGPAPRSLDRFAIQAVDPVTGEVKAESTDGTPMRLPDGEVVIRIDTGRRVTGKAHG